MHRPYDVSHIQHYRQAIATWILLSLMNNDATTKDDEISETWGYGMGGKDGEPIGLSLRMRRKDEMCIGIYELERSLAHATYYFIYFH